MIRAALVLWALAGPALAQGLGEIEVQPLLDDPIGILEDGAEEIGTIEILPDDGFETTEQELRVSQSDGATLRLLDRLTGRTQDLNLSVGDTGQAGVFDVTLRECRYPTDNPSSDSFARLVIADTASGAELFRGWMVASSPALMALDHPRYDLWVIRCRFLAPTPEVVAGISSPRPRPRPQR